MTLFGVDLHPQFQAGISIEQIRAEGFDFMACKVSQGVTVYDSRDWLRRGQAAGLLCLGYHYLEPGNEAAQARVFAQQLLTAGVPGMVDAEFPTPTGDTLTVAGIRTFVNAVRVFGASVPLLYLPHWYWQRMGSPDLQGLPSLWASSYVTGSGFASALFAGVPQGYWADYGSLPVKVLQFTDRAAVAGRSVDGDAFAGSRADFAALLEGGSVSTANDVWALVMDDPYVAPDGTKGGPKPAGVYLAAGAAHAATGMEQASAAHTDTTVLLAEVAELRKSVADLTANLPATVKAAIAGIVVGVQITVDGKPVPPK